MSGSLSVFGRLQTLLHESDMSATDFVAVCAACGFKTNGAAISRAAQAQKFTHELDELLHPLIARLEDLVRRAAEPPEGEAPIDHPPRITNPAVKEKQAPTKLSPKLSPKRSKTP